MPTYVTLLNFTDQGIRNIKDSPKRAEAYTRSMTQSAIERWLAPQVTFGKNTRARPILR